MLIYQRISCIFWNGCEIIWDTRIWLFKRGNGTPITDDFPMKFFIMGIIWGWSIISWGFKPQDSATMGYKEDIFWGIWKFDQNTGGLIDFCEVSRFPATSSGCVRIIFLDIHYFRHTQFFKSSWCIFWVTIASFIEFTKKMFPEDGDSPQWQILFGRRDGCDKLKCNYAPSGNQTWQSDIHRL